jgi:single-strand DNA-binding protein
MTPTARKEREMTTPIEGINTAVLAGILSSDPRELDLQSGSRLLRLEVTTRTADGERAETVPVAWFDPPGSAPALAEGDRVVIVGRVRRRYYATAGGVQSQTEVLATVVVPATRRAAVRRALAAAVSALEGEATS